MWPRKTLDIGFRNLARAMRNACFSHRSVLSDSALSSGQFLCLSIRSGFDTLLRSLSFPPGSEVLFSELTVPDMPRIAEANGVKAVGVGLDDRTWLTDMKSLEESITSDTRAIVVAHLFGRRGSMKAISNIAKKRNLLLIEDCAQSYVRSDDCGNPLADVSMFSFGPIKTNTCLAGGLLNIRSEQLSDRFAEFHLQLERQRNLRYGIRVARYSGLKCLVSKVPYGSLYRILEWLGRDPDQIISQVARGFSGSNFFPRIRKRPSVALEKLLLHRMRNDDHSNVIQRSALGKELAAQLSTSISVPAHSGTDSDSYWVFPVVSRDPEGLASRLVANGYDATCRSSLVAVENRSQSDTVGKQFLRRVVFLPLETKMREADIHRLAELVNVHELESSDGSLSLTKGSTDASDPVTSRGKTRVS